ncbi:MAG TPA: hypothetical protein VJT72_05260 [Pseudonocardiaceae bacterium]|nr:hypothetical protein [Pseudonocardiaceae bacterium]
MAHKHRPTSTGPHGPRPCFQASLTPEGRKPLVVRFGGIPLQRQKKTIITDRLPDPPTTRTELIPRLRVRRCEYCDQRTDVEVHQVRTLADLARAVRPQPRWAHLMAQIRRKTLVVCNPCHQAIHHGHPTALTA